MGYPTVSRCPACNTRREFDVELDNLGRLEYVDALPCEGGTEDAPCEYEPTTQELMGVYHDHLDQMADRYPEEED